MPGLDEFIAAHGHHVTDPIIENDIAYMRKELGITTIAATGSCFGGRLVFRHLAPGRGVDLAFSAHPFYLTDEEVLRITGPLSLASAGINPSFHFGENLKD